jgi:hypothetical protein
MGGSAGTLAAMNLTATHWAVIDSADIRLTLAVGDETTVSLVLGSADCIGLVAQLTAAAARHMGRSVDGQFRLDPEVVQEIRERAKDARAALCTEALAQVG